MAGKSYTGISISRVVVWKKVLTLFCPRPGATQRLLGKAPARGRPLVHDTLVLSYRFLSCSRGTKDWSRHLAGRVLVVLPKSCFNHSILTMWCLAYPKTGFAPLTCTLLVFASCSSNNPLLLSFSPYQYKRLSNHPTVALPLLKMISFFSDTTETSTHEKV